MQRDEANQRLRKLEEGENYFIILPESQGRRDKPRGDHICANICFPVPGRQKMDTFVDCDESQISSLMERPP